MDHPSQAQRSESQALPGGSFRLLVQKLAYQAMMGLGVLENPLTREHNLNLDQARMVIDDLRMLRDKTTGNLDAEELEHLEGVLSELGAKLQELG